MDCLNIIQNGDGAERAGRKDWGTTALIVLRGQELCGSALLESLSTFHELLLFRPIHQLILLPLVPLIVQFYVSATDYGE